METDKPPPEQEEVPPKSDDRSADADITDVLEDVVRRLMRIEAKADAASSASASAIASLTTKVDNLAVVVTDVSGRIDQLREWLGQEEQARIGLGIQVLDHEVRLSDAGGGRRDRGA